ncbi:IS3 family transposase [Spirillospora sp. NPDC047279]|uniref:IS3 family transposase n=1 Tax=Spirillospora sp. NPDC047279 TaxID=3155478 RepID=UPI0033EE17B4
MIAQVHAASNGVYGSPRVHAELRLARGIIVGHGTVEKLMRPVGIKGLPYSRTRHPVPQIPTAADLTDRDFHRDAPNQQGIRWACVMIPLHSLYLCC